MSEHAARSCSSKKRYKSERLANDVAKRTQKVTGVKINSYPCDFCGGYHVGSTLVVDPHEASTARNQRHQKYHNITDRFDKFKFQRKPSR